MPWRKKWQPTPVFLPGEPHGQRSLVGYSPRGCRVRQDWANNTKESPHGLLNSYIKKNILTMMVGKLTNILTGIKTQETSLRSSSLSHAWFKQQQCLMRKWWCLVPNGWKVRKKRYWTSYWTSSMWELTNSLQMLIKTPKALISGEKNSVIAMTASHLIPTGQWLLGKLTAYNYVWNLHLHIFLWNRQTVITIKRLTCIR